MRRGIAYAQAEPPWVKRDKRSQPLVRERRNRRCEIFWILKLQISPRLNRIDVNLGLLPEFCDITRRIGCHFRASGRANERCRTSYVGGVFLQIDKLMCQSLGHAHRIVFDRDPSIRGVIHIVIKAVLEREFRVLLP